MEPDMAEEEIGGAYRQRFVKVLLPGFFDKLLIPPKFTQHLVNGDHQKATILSPLGKFWHVDLQREGHKMFFGTGWEDFAKAHGLSVGHFLVFRHLGKMVFTIKIFDKSGCLKEYDSTASTYASKREADVDVEILDVAPKDVGPVNWISSSKKGRSKKSASANSHGQRHIDETPPKSSGRKRPNRRKRVPFFERMVGRSTLISMRMNVPREFCLSNGLATLGEITLIDRKQRLWPVLFRPGSRESHLGKGWRLFSEANNLKEGDRCIFKLASEKVMRVRIARC